MIPIPSALAPIDRSVRATADPVLEITSPPPLGLSPEEITQWRQDLEAHLARLEQHPEQGLGFIEEQVRQCTLELQRKVVERAMQAQADAVDENCPSCQRPLIEKKRRVRKTIHSYCGSVQLFRTHGWCKRCEQWVFPADTALGLLDNSTASPRVQEMSALLVSKMPCEQAQTQSKRQRGEELKRWHWVYTATGFRLEQRCRKGKQRAVITERSYVATRQGVESMIQQLHVEALRRGLGRAERVLVIADGAVWIWNAVQDRFSEASQRLDLFHANSYLWAVANEMHGANTAAARQWVKPLLRQVRQDQVAQVILSLEELKSRLSESAATAAQQTIDYYRSNQSRMQSMSRVKNAASPWAPERLSRPVGNCNAA